MWLECFWGTIVLTRVVKAPSQIPPAQNKPVFPFFSPSHMICHLSAVLGNFYCTVLTMETLNRAGSSRPKAESNPLEILFCFFFFCGKSLTSKFETNSANLIYLMVTISRFCFPSRTPRGQWQTFTAENYSLLLLPPSVLLLSITCQRS